MCTFGPTQRCNFKKFKVYEIMFISFSWGLNCSNFRFCFIKKTMQDSIKRTLLRKNLEGESFLLLFNTILYAFLSILVDTIDG